MLNGCRALVIWLLLGSSLCALDLDSTYLANIRQGMDLAFNDHYDSAKTLFSDMVAADSSDYAAYFFEAAVYHAEMIDAEDYSDLPIFMTLIDSAIAKGQRAFDAGDNRAWAALTIGNSHGYVAAYEGKEGSWFAAIKQGIKAKNQYLKALEFDPTLYDAYLGLGNYHYWRSVKTDFINWMPFVPDRKEQGLRELALARDSSLFSQAMAANSLLWIHVRGGSPLEAQEALSWLKSRYPTCRMVLWGEAIVDQMSGNLRGSIAAYGQLIDQIEQQPSNYFNLIECRYHRARMFRSLGMIDSAKVELQALIGYPCDTEVAKRQEEKLDSAAKMLEVIEKRDSD